MSLIDDAVGGVLLGMLVSVLMFGVVTLQTALYFGDERVQNEPRTVKLLVGIVYILETVHTAFTMYNIYSLTVLNFGKFENLPLINWSEPAYILTGIVTMSIVHSFFTWRVWTVRKSEKPLALTGVIAVFATSHFVFGMMVSDAYRFKTWPDFQKTKFALVTVAGGLGSAAVADLLIAISLTLYLRRNYEELLSIRLQSTLNRISYYVVATGTLTALTSLGTIIAFASDKNGGVFLGMAAIQSKVYANALLANLNSRRTLRTRLQPPTGVIESAHAWSPNGSKSRRVESIQFLSGDAVAPGSGPDLEGVKLQSLA